MNCIALIIRFLLTALVFLISYKIGLDEAKLNPKPDVSCPKAAPTPLHSSSSTNHLLSHDIDSPAGVNLFDSSSDFIFHKNIGKTMNTRVFSSLYHTNSQVKAEFIVTSLKQWEDSRTKKVHKCIGQLLGHVRINLPNALQLSVFQRVITHQCLSCIEWGPQQVGLTSSLTTSPGMKIGAKENKCYLLFCKTLMISGSSFWP